TVDSLDASPFEGATLIHDLNQSIAPMWQGRSSLVLDAGTLEHVFNAAQAWQNALQLVAVGGSLVCATGINNFCGHGFYQFSPELLARVLSPANGFRLDALIACDAFRSDRWYAVTDPARVKRRVQIVGPYPVLLL